MCPGVRGTSWGRFQGPWQARGGRYINTPNTDGILAEDQGNDNNSCEIRRFRAVTGAGKIGSGVRRLGMAGLSALGVSQLIIRYR